MNAKEFREAIDQFNTDFGRAVAPVEGLNRLVGRFEESLSALAEKPATTNNADMSRLAEQLSMAINESIRRWTERRRSAQPVTDLSERFEDRAILLVAGKVNSGKSTFVNFLVEQLENAGAQSRGFMVDGRRTIRADPRFAVGAIETTSCMQGVEIDKRLVFLDSPGLHSVTKAHADLTERYTDAADAVLWLSPSISPGQVQELHHLEGQLRKRTPLLPVISRSDRRFELDEWTGEGMPVAETRNKPAKDRRAQEADVRGRAEQLGGIHDLRDPISVSVKAYKESRQTRNDWDEAGLARLFDCLKALVQRANRYKVGKAEQVVRNYIDTGILAELDCHVRPQVARMVDRAELASADIRGLQPALIEEIGRRVRQELPKIAKRHKDRKDIRAVANDLSRVIDASLTEHLTHELTTFVGDMANIMAALAPVKLSAQRMGQFDDIEIQVDQRKGAAAKSVAASVGGLAGGFGGSIVPGIGTLIGAAVGGAVGSLLGTLIGASFERTVTVSTTVGVSSSDVLEHASRAAEEQIKIRVAAALQQLVAMFDSTKSFAEAVSSEIITFKRNVNSLNQGRE